MLDFSAIQDGSVVRLQENGTVVDVYLNQTIQRRYAFSNNDPNEMNIWCYLKGKKNLVIDCGGAMLTLHGRMTPFLLDDCENVTIRNCSIDYDRPFYTQGTILYADSHCVELDIHPGFPYRVVKKNLIIEAPFWENDLHDGFMLFQEFDPNTNTLAYDSPVRIYGVGENTQVDPNAPLPMGILTAEMTKRGTLLLRGVFSWPYTVGNILVMTHEKRHHPAICIHKSRNILLKDIQIYQAGSMGVMGQLSENITLQDIQVKAKAYPNRMVSTNCDAVHFVACRGDIEVLDCTLERMMDDGINVHGVYTRVESVNRTGAIETRLMHYQHFGVCYYEVGDEVAVYRGRSCQIVLKFNIQSVEMIAPDRILLRCNGNLDNVSEGDYLENLSATPNLHVKGLRTGFNRPRGVLVTTPGRVIIEDSILYNSGYGIHIAGDTAFWYESGRTKDVLIRNNRFIRCGHNMGDYSIAVTPEYQRTETAPYYHERIMVSGNTFETFLDGILYAEGVRSLTVSDNVVIKDFHYPKRTQTCPVVVKECGSLECDMDYQQDSELDE